MPYTHAGPALWLNADKSKVVPEGSEEAAYLLVADGGQLSDEDAKQYGVKAKAGADETKLKAGAAENKSGVIVERDDTPRNIKLGGK